MLFLILAWCSCKRSNQKVYEDDLLTSNSVYESTKVSELAFLGPADTLMIKVLFSDCGEWGGHKESIDIFRSNKGELLVNYKIDTVSCSALSKISDYNDRTKFASIILDTNLTITKETEKKIFDFIHWIFVLNLKTPKSNLSNGDVYWINCTSGYLSLTYFNSTLDNTYFHELRKQILGKILISFNKSIKSRLNYTYIHDLD